MKKCGMKKHGEKCCKKEKVMNRSKDLLVYYGWPNAFNSATNGWDNNKVVKDMAKYDLIVFGDGLQDPGHGDHANAHIIIDKLKEIKPWILIFGYVDTAQSYSSFCGKVDGWNAMAVHGIFMDKAGYDFGTVDTNGRVAFNSKVNYVHGRTYSKICFPNSWKLQHILGTQNDVSYPNSTWNPNGVATKLLRSDWALLESFGHNASSGYESASEWKDRGDAAVGFSSKINLASVFSIDPGVGDAQDRFDFGYMGSVMFGLDAIGSGPGDYGASSAATVFYNRVSLVGVGEIFAVVNVVVDPSDADVYARYVQAAKLFVDFSSDAQDSGIVNT